MVRSQDYEHLIHVVWTKASHPLNASPYYSTVWRLSPRPANRLASRGVNNADTLAKLTPRTGKVRLPFSLYRTINGDYNGMTLISTWTAFSMVFFFRPLSFLCGRHSFLFDRGKTIEIWVWSNCVPEPRTPCTLFSEVLMTFLLSCRLTPHHFNKPAFVSGERSVLSFSAFLLCKTQIFFCFWTQSSNGNEFSRISCQEPARLVHCLARFWWRVLLSCRLTRLDLNSVLSSFAFQDGVLRQLYRRSSSFKTSPGRFCRIIAMSKPVVDDISTRTTPGVALWGGKPRRKYFSSLHLTS